MIRKVYQEGVVVPWDGREMRGIDAVFEGQADAFCEKMRAVRGPIRVYRNPPLDGLPGTLGYKFTYVKRPPRRFRDALPVLLTPDAYSRSEIRYAPHGVQRMPVDRRSPGRGVILVGLGEAR